MHLRSHWDKVIRDDTLPGSLLLRQEATLNMDAEVMTSYHLATGLKKEPWDLITLPLHY